MCAISVEAKDRGIGLDPRWKGEGPCAAAIFEAEDIGFWVGLVGEVMDGEDSSRGRRENAHFPVGLAGLQRDLAEGELVGFEEQLIEDSNFTVDSCDRFNEVGEFKERREAEIEPVERGDAGGEGVPCLSAEFIGSG